MSTRILCSGLGDPCCPKREACANFKHWIDDPRSVFSACLDGKLDHFAPLVPFNSTPAPVAGQLELFA